MNRNHPMSVTTSNAANMLKPDDNKPAQDRTFTVNCSEFEQFCSLNIKKEVNFEDAADQMEAAQDHTFNDTEFDPYVLLNIKQEAPDYDDDWDQT